MSATPAANGSHRPSRNSRSVSSSVAVRSRGSGCRRSGRRHHGPASTRSPPTARRMPAAPGWRQRSADVGVDLARAEHRVARQVDERHQRPEPPEDLPDRFRAVPAQVDEHGDHGDKDERVPERHGQVRPVDVTVAHVRELVQQHGAKRVGVGVRERDEPAAHRHVAPADPPEGEPGRAKVERVPDEAWQRPDRELAGEPLDLRDHVGCVGGAERPEAPRRSRQRGSRR